MDAIYPNEVRRGNAHLLRNVWFIVICALVGCADKQQQVCQALQEPCPAACSEQYRVGCPDVLELAVRDRPDLSGLRFVEANGCIDLGSLGGLRVEFMTTSEIESEIARTGSLPRDAVRVKVEGYRSQHVYLYGQVSGEQRAVPYRGPETVVDLLKRAGGITLDGASHDVRVVRADCSGNAEPESHQVDLRAVVLEGDHRSNVIVQPFDQIHVPENKECRIKKCLHPLLQPLCKFFAFGEY